jgi:hypothetical protein
MLELNDAFDWEWTVEEWIWKKPKQYDSTIESKITAVLQHIKSLNIYDKKGEKNMNSKVWWSVKRHYVYQENNRTSENIGQ